MSDTSSIYSIISINDLEEAPSTTDYTLVNALAPPPTDTYYGYADKYNLHMPDSRQQEWDDMHLTQFNEPEGIQQPEYNCMNLADHIASRYFPDRGKSPVPCTHE